MKSGIRILAIEDSPFDRSQRKCRLVGVVGRQDIIEGIISFDVSVDGSDSTFRIINSVKGSRFLDQVKLIALNGNTVAGMNIIDIERLSKTLKIPVIAITRSKPHPKSLKLAMKKAAITNYAKKAAMLDLLAKRSTVSKISGFYVQRTGASEREAANLVENSVKLLRLGHMIASGMAKGESKGRL